MNQKHIELKNRHSALKKQHKALMDRASQVYQQVLSLEKEIESVCEHDLVYSTWGGAEGMDCTICTYAEIY